MANIITDWPVGVKSLTDDELVPVTPNMFLLACTGGVVQQYDEKEAENFGARLAYQEILLQTWWSIWSRQVFPNLFPYNSLKESCCHENL